jgi:prevent-host-death family protein
MNVLPQTAPISDLRTRQTEILHMAESDPVVLMSRSKPAAVLLSPSQWDALVERMEELEWRETIRLRAIAAQQSPDLSYDEFMKELRAYHEQA